MTKRKFVLLIGYMVAASWIAIMALALVVTVGYYGLIMLVLLATGHAWPVIGIFGLIVSAVGAYYGYQIWRNEI